MNTFDLIVTIISCACLLYCVVLVVFSLVKKITIKHKFKKQMKEEVKNVDEKRTETND